MKFEVQLTDADITAIGDHIIARLGTAGAATVATATVAATGDKPDPKAAAKAAKAAAAAEAAAKPAEGPTKDAVLTALRAFSDLYTRPKATAALNKYAASFDALKPEDYAALVADLGKPPADVAEAPKDEF